MSQKVSLSEAHTNRINIAKRRPYRPEEHNDFVSKKNRNSGDPYRGRNGNFHAGISPPTNAKLCGTCPKPGCLLTGIEKLNQFLAFRSHDYNGQTAILMNSIEFNIPNSRVAQNSRKRFTYHYNLSVNGMKIAVCRKTLREVFGITDERIKVLVKKMEAGNVLPMDQRGMHGNHQKTPDNIRQAIRAHIQRFPSYESHYGRGEGNPTRKYLEPSLSISRMYEMFVQVQRDHDGPECEPWLYTHIFKTEFKDLRIMCLKTDTCDSCNRYDTLMKDATAEEMLDLERDRDFHQLLAQSAYRAYSEDQERAYNMEPQRQHELRIHIAFNGIPGVANTGTLRLDAGKVRDLRKLLEFLSGEAYAYYDTIITEQMDIRNIEAHVDELDTQNPLVQQLVQEQEEIDRVEAGVE